ncbi:MAG: ornithine carbamoyltransferase [Firmicutes bacterium]|nr:ornithine carbamoyltransferase [Bacillota bacterium]
MAVDMKGKSLLSIADLTLEEIEQIFATTEMLKLQKKTGQPHPILAGRTLGMIFEKPSTRTRVSFEAGMYQLGGYALYLSSNDLQLGRGETIADTTRVLSRYVDGIMARVFSHNTVVELAKYGSVPVINGLSDMEHPCQILGDLFTAIEKKGKLAGLKMAYIGDGNNVCNSLLLGCAKVGMDMAAAHPRNYDPPASILDEAKKIAKKTGCKIKVSSDISSALDGADIIYTDVWTSMGQDAEKKERLKAFSEYQVNEKMLKKAKDDVIVMHCLPAHRGEEITDEVMDGPHAVVIDEAENRMHVQKAILALLIR